MQTTVMAGCVISYCARDHVSYYLHTGHTSQNNRFSLTSQESQNIGIDEAGNVWAFRYRLQYNDKNRLV